MKGWEPERTNELREKYREERRVLRRLVNKAKREAWGDMIKKLEDPWGMGYKLVMDKLRPAGPSITEILDESTVARTLTSLFPRDERENNRIRESRALDEVSPYDRVTETEVAWAIGKRAECITAPGLDGISMRTPPERD